MTQYHRRTAPKVRDGKVQKKNRGAKTVHLGLVVDRERPARGFRHVITKKDVWNFIDLIPDWSELSSGLERIVLSSGDQDWDGLYKYYHYEHTGAIFLSAMEAELWMTTDDEEWVAESAWVLERLKLKPEPVKGGLMLRFNSQQAQAYMLLDVFLHELGHHHDRITGRHPRQVRRGEAYAIRYAEEQTERLWHAYVQRFGDPTKG
ncbi:MAG: hypothetical protein ACI9QL_002364 [Candidatus Omnitrophota bacterium]|jgi:hypothetical protein